MRPISISWSSRSLLMSIVLGVVGSFAAYTHLHETLAKVQGQAGAYLIVGLLEALLLPLLLWFFALRRASRIAKWLVVALTILETWSILARIEEQYILFGLAIFCIAILSVVLKIVATILMFTPASREWFARRGRPPQADATPFN